MNIAADRPEKITEPRLRMDPISAERYTSKDWFHREWKQMWMRTWQIGGLSGHAPEPAFLIAKPFSAESVKAVISQALFFERKSQRIEANLANR